MKFENIDFRSLYYENRKKHDELSAFYWFLEALKIHYQGFEISESPDFIIQMESKNIGVELTLAERGSPHQFSMQQIESAQSDFGEKLRQSMNPVLPINVHLVFEDGVAVQKKELMKSVMEVAALIDEVSKSMKLNSVELIVKNQERLGKIENNFHISPNFPEFLQSIQLMNDGQKNSTVTGSRICILEDFTEKELAVILGKKHKALLNYTQCDEQWLVILSGQVPPLFEMKDHTPTLMIPSTATHFHTPNISHPIESSFDKIYFFSCPTKATLLK